ncbi:NAD(P)/FAD-dependent oxidoreductase [Urbifossiella limnaea]|uniref:Protoporphyrinogen oxidase n=1 Tax=Urbifossiella limnaea TaxID=2528023 RepID=A0A517XLZ1_9BACT|nr:FAD-dependent oxidoreductase [Urbifossiella limnaea]QDU18512.1 protoporphyrinogen oxidase [Urbifossiella limnaea]
MHERGPRVAVVGAGVAGLACARALADHGFDVTVFDKGRGPGGRTATRRVDPGLAFDHGAQYFTARHPDFARAVAAWLVRGVVAEWGGRVVKLEGGVATDTPPQPRYVGVPGMAAVAADLAATLAVRRATRVARAARTPAGWQVVDEAGGGAGPFDFLVAALPAPQAAELLAPHPFAAEAACTPMTPCWAVLLAFADRLDVPWDGAFVHGSPLSWVARNSSKPGRPGGADCWVLHAGAGWSAAHLEDSPDAVVPLLLYAFAAATGRTLPPVAYRAAHRWRYSLGADPAARTTLFDAAAGLAVCGDWLAGGRVEGAFLSGAAAAGRIVRAADGPVASAG